MDVAAVLALPLLEVGGPAEGVVESGLRDVGGPGEESLEVAVEVVHLKVKCQRRACVGWIEALTRSISPTLSKLIQCGSKVLPSVVSGLS